MAYAASIGSSIEGEKIRLSTRKWIAVPPVRCPETNKKKHRFRLGMRGEAEIWQAYDVPEKTVWFSTSLTKVGDAIQGSSVSGWAWKALGPPNVEKCSHTHSGTVVQISGGCMAQVDAPAREHSDSAVIQARHPPIKQIRRDTTPDDRQPLNALIENESARTAPPVKST